MKLTNSNALARIQRKGNPHILLVRMQTGAATWKTVGSFLQKLKMEML